jgi:YihY family inner membrane protein
MRTVDPFERGVRWFDDRQQERWWLGFPVGVIRKYADDRGSAFAGLVTFHVFLGMLPLLVVVLTLLGRMLAGSEDLRDAVLESTLAQLPVVGARIREDVSTLGASGPVLAIAIAGMLWTASGIYHSLQLAMNQVWNVEGVDRQGWVARHVRAIALFTLVVAAAFGTRYVRGWTPDVSVPVLGPAMSALGGSLLAGLLLLGVFRLVVSPAIRSVQLVPAALLAGLLWELLQRIGTMLVGDRLTQADDLYGTLGLVVVTLFWINLLARSAIFANEWAVVSWRGLWPRRIAQPPLTEADRRVLDALVHNERRRPEQRVDVTFTGSADELGHGGEPEPASAQSVDDGLERRMVRGVASDVEQVDGSG